MGGAGAENAASKPAGLKIGLFGPMFRVWAVLSHPVWRILSIDASPSDGSLPVRDFLSLLLSAVWSLAIWAYFGAAISRVAAVQLATGEQVGWAAALRWARAKWAAYFSAPAMPMLAVAVVVLPIFVLGLLMRLDLLAFAAALIWPLVLVGGFVMTVLLAGVLLGWPLMWATVSVEGTDSFDALNRTYAYVFQRPLRYLFYVIVAGAIGWLGWIVVETLAASVIWLASWAASWAPARGFRNSRSVLPANRRWPMPRPASSPFGAGGLSCWPSAMRSATSQSPRRPFITCFAVMSTHGKPTKCFSTPTPAKQNSVSRSWGWMPPARRRSWKLPPLAPSRPMERQSGIQRRALRQCRSAGPPYTAPGPRPPAPI